MRNGVYVLPLAFACLCPATLQAQPAFPGAEGFGTETVAGRGGAIIVVESLEATGPGSLAECVETPGPRTCVFAVSGTLDVGNQLRIAEPFLTLAGQTAPSPGVTIRGPVVIRTHDVLVQHLRFRAGDIPEADAIGIISDPQGEGTFNIVLDHITASWANDENISAYPGSPDVAGQPGYTVTNFTVSNSLSSEGLSFAPGHSMGFLAARPGLLNVSVIKNLFLHNGGRNPKLGNGQFLIANNVIYNWGSTATTMGSQAGVFDGAVISNVWEIGPDVASPTKPPINITTGNDGANTLHLAGNRFAGDTPADQWSLAVVEMADVSSQDRTPTWLPDVDYIATDTLVDTLAECSGARPRDRDPVDERVVASLLAGDGSLTDCVEESSSACSTKSPRTPPGGWPPLAENQVELDIPPDPNGDDDDDGYTNAEEWLHMSAAELECPSEDGDPAGDTEGSTGSPGGDSEDTGSPTAGEPGASSGGPAGTTGGSGVGSTSGPGSASRAGDASGTADTDGTAAGADASEQGCGCKSGGKTPGVAAFGILGLMLLRRRSAV